MVQDLTGSATNSNGQTVVDVTTAQRTGQCTRWNRCGYLHHQFHHAIVGQLGRQHR